MADLQEWCDLDQLENDVEWRDAVPGWFSQPLPDEPTVRDWIADLQSAVIDVINAAQARGVVCIVTNALPGWVDKTVRKWLPQLTQYISGHGVRPPIKVIYAQQAYQKPKNELAWVNELGPYMWWKRAAMRQALDGVDELYRLDGDSAISPVSQTEVLPTMSWCSNADSKRIASIISVGDDEAEMQATELAARSYEDRRIAHAESRSERSGCKSQPRQIHNDDTSGGSIIGGTRCSSSHWPWVKLVKCTEHPHIKQVTVQLHEILELLPELVSERRHFRISMDRNPGEELTHTYDVELTPKLRPRASTVFDPSVPLEPRNRSDLCSKLLVQAPPPIGVIWRALCEFRRCERQ